MERPTTPTITEFASSAPPLISDSPPYSVSTTPTPEPTLASVINTSTQHAHTKINQRITRLLPLCLPPYSSKTEIYAWGVAHFLPIYETFEEALKKYAVASGVVGVGQGLKESEEQERIRDILRQVYIPQLLRTQRMKEDMRFLKLRLATLTQIRNQSPTVQLWLQSFQSRLESNKSTPLILLAYTYVLYLALFAGGRWMRKQFFDGLDLPTDSPAEDKYLSFWYFDPPAPDDLHASEDTLKDMYKVNFATVSTLLTEEEKEEVVREAGRIFDVVSGIVDELEVKGDVMRQKEKRQFEIWAVGVTILGLVAVYVSMTILRGIYNYIDWDRWGYYDLD
ncbi:MAG: heme oxygenase [Cirrosporium novae-zelandiae]|nr:MAG: heme oxygenase [Cirrosporium novae-zelandiae]